MYCSKCGQNIANNNFCNVCGEHAEKSTFTLNAQYNLPPQAGVNTGPNSFLERVHNFGRSLQFLIGIILFTIGTMLPIVLTFSVFSIFQILFVALPLVGFWLLYGSSKSGTSAKSTLTSLLLFKINTIIGIVLTSIAAFALIIIGSIGIIAVSVNDPTMGGIVGGLIGVAIFFVLAILVLYIIFYYVPLLRILNGIRDGINFNQFGKIRGVVSLTVFSCIAIGFGVLSVVIMVVFAAGFPQIMQNTMMDLPDYMQWYFDGFNLMHVQATMILTSIIPFITYAGNIICLVVLNKFNNSIEKKV